MQLNSNESHYALTLGADADNSINKLMLSILGAVGEFERSLIRERQAEGIAKAKERGVYKGAKRKADRTKVKNMLAEGVPKAQIAKRLGIARQTVYDIIASDKILN